MENPQEGVKKILSIKSCRTEATEVWALVLSETCRDLIGSLPERMKEIVNSESTTTKYLAY